jgi:antirestriction protein ArdC
MASPQPAGNPAPERRDFRKEVTESIIQMLEQGVAPWQKPWDAATVGNLAVPFNPTSNNPYRGGNAIYLMASAIRKGFDDPRWMTYKQAAANDWQVRGGEKGTQIEFWEKRAEGKDGKSLAAGEGSDHEVTGRQSESRFVHRVYTVFNAKQIDRIPPQEPRAHSAFAAIETGEQILRNSGAQITHDQADRAFYSRSTDSIHLPLRELFHDAPGYYGTALHELAHWTGHPDRLNRQTLNDSYRFGDQNYAREELRAELASLFLAAERGIPHDPGQHASYVSSWIKALRDDKNEIFRAAYDASRASEFLLALERDKSFAQSLVASPETSAAALEQEAARIQSDLEAEQDLTVPNFEPVVQESGQAVGRFRPQNGTLRIHDNLAGVDYPVALDPATDIPAANGLEASKQPLRNGAEKSLRAAEELTRKQLGNDARTSIAMTDSGIYRGFVIGETADYVVQQISKSSAIAHPKELLDGDARAGQKLSITYSNSHALVREVRERNKTQAMER